MFDRFLAWLFALLSDLFNDHRGAPNGLLEPQPRDEIETLYNTPILSTDEEKIAYYTNAIAWTTKQIEICKEKGTDAQVAYYVKELTRLSLARIGVIEKTLPG